MHFLVEPIPWRMTSTAELAYVPELILWYVGRPAAAIGLLHGFRRDPLLTCLLAGTD